MSIGEALIAALLGYGVVFTGLILLMAVVTVMGKAMKTAQPAAAPAPSPAPAATPAAEPAPAPAPELPAARGTAGEVKLFDVPDRDAAMIMAIVAEKTKIPLNQLRFKSIKEVHNDEV